MNLDWYYTFLILAKHLNYRKASEELFLTEPTLHQQIKKLEKHIQVKLFETIGRRLTLTTTGKEFIPIAERLIKTYEDGIKTIQLKDRNLSKQLDIAVSPYISTYLLPKFLPAFLQKHPDIKITISVVARNMTLALENNQFDIGIDREVPFTKNLYTEKICEGKIALFLPKSDTGLEEIELFQKYQVLSDNHPHYWDSLKEEIKSLVPETEFLAIKDIPITEKLIEMEQGISYLPLYLKNDFQSDIAYQLPQAVTTPVSFTYLMHRKENKEIAIFKQEFIDFINLEQSKI
ncbi:LysR substrate-binding domain-containing protein [Streptococcus downei]|uniref:LysR family transcriptional regulator n=1 Tax=Streptococcus downei MFe28 TaxID=764290 RepID=A0A380JG39_STRDO|nr:LysR family transcriptional regulator [Streptococcus downei]SUN36904.1 LysR family transcriptional regulator [Streptococcus downei MFe28]